MQLGGDLGVPAASEPAPDIPDGALVLLEKLTPFVGDGVDFLAVPLGGAHVAHIFEQLQRGVDGAWTRGVEPAGPLLQLPYDLVAVGGLVLEQVEDNVLEIPLLEHPPPLAAMTKPRTMPAPEEPPHPLWTEHVLRLLPQTSLDTTLRPSIDAGRAPRARRPAFLRAPSLPRDRSPPDPRASCPPRRRRARSPEPPAPARAPPAARAPPGAPAPFSPAPSPCPSAPACGSPQVPSSPSIRPRTPAPQRRERPIRGRETGRDGSQDRPRRTGTTLLSPTPP